MNLVQGYQFDEAEQSNPDILRQTLFQALHLLRCNRFRHFSIIGPSLIFGHADKIIANQDLRLYGNITAQSCSPAAGEVGTTPYRESPRLFAAADQRRLKIVSVIA